MKRTILTIAALFCAITIVAAQEPEEVQIQEEQPQELEELQEEAPVLEPGIYSVIDGTYTPLVYCRGTEASSATNILGIEIGDKKYKYKGASAEVPVTDKIVMVINPERSVMKATLRTYDPFVKDMTPGHIIIVRLTVEKNKRYYDKGTTVSGFNVERKDRVEFEWELIGENTFEITADFEPGEYAIAFKPATPLGEFEFTAVYGFCVEASAAE